MSFFLQNNPKKFKKGMSDYFQELGFAPLRDGEAPNGLLHMARFLRDMGMWDLVEQDKLPPPASKKSLEEDLKDLEITETNKQCPVCLKMFESGFLAKSMPCKHTFHNECILPWLEKVLHNS